VGEPNRIQRAFRLFLNTPPNLAPLLNSFYRIMAGESDSNLKWRRCNDHYDNNCTGSTSSTKTSTSTSTTTSSCAQRPPLPSPSRDRHHYYGQTIKIVEMSTFLETGIPQNAYALSASSYTSRVSLCGMAQLACARDCDSVSILFEYSANCRQSNSSTKLTRDSPGTSTST